MNIRDYITGGNATFTVTSRKTGKHFTYKVRAMPDRPRSFFVSVLTGPDNTSDYDYIGMLKQSQTQPEVLGVTQTRGSKVAETAPSWLAIKWLVAALNTDKDIESQAYVQHMGRCGRCGRTLTHPESIESGFGPECATRVGG